MAKRSASSRQEKTKDEKKRTPKKASKATIPKANAKPKAGSPKAAGAAPKEPTWEEIAARAYDLYLRRGRAPGDPVEDWLRAERELRAERNV